MAAPPKYTAPTPFKIQETSEMPSMDILKEDLLLSASEDSDDDVIYVKTTGPPKYTTNSYGYLVEEIPTYQTTVVTKHTRDQLKVQANKQYVKMNPQKTTG